MKRTVMTLVTAAILFGAVAIATPACAGAGGDDRGAGQRNDQLEDLIEKKGSRRDAEGREHRRVWSRRVSRR